MSRPASAHANSAHSLGTHAPARCVDWMGGRSAHTYASARAHTDERRLGEIKNPTLSAPGTSLVRGRIGWLALAHKCIETHGAHTRERVCLLLLLLLSPLTCHYRRSFRPSPSTTIVWLKCRWKELSPITFFVQTHLKLHCIQHLKKRELKFRH